MDSIDIVRFHNASVVERTLFAMDPQPAEAKGKHETTKSKMVKAAKVSFAAKEEIFTFWKMHFKKSKLVKLDKKREIAIGAAIHDYGMEKCRQAIEGCGHSDFHMGRNKRQTVYNDIELILRDSSHIEDFITIYENHTGTKDVDTDW